MKKKEIVMNLYKIFLSIYLFEMDLKSLPSVDLVCFDSEIGTDLVLRYLGVLGW